ncbi:TPA: bile acid:sodium symporter [Stenotrophomonas maltophilia]|nr:bile acid:sodium symporter [Stenotrophomonas maltophilia]
MNTQALVLHCLQASILGTVFSFGLQAAVTDALFLVRNPGQLVRSVLAIFVVMPVAAVIIVEIFALPHATEIALVVLALAPIPPLLPKKESKAGGEGAHALGLMVVMGLLAIVMVPLLLWLLGHYFDRDLKMPPQAIAKVIVVMIVLPLLAGMVVRAIAPALAARLARPIALVSLVLLVVIAALILSKVTPIVVNLLHGGTLVALIAFVVIGLAVGQLLAGPVPQRQTVLALSTASRHPAIALAIAKTNFPNEPFLDATIVLYLLVVTVLAIPYVQWRRRRTPPSPHST